VTKKLSVSLCVFVALHLILDAVLHSFTCKKQSRFSRGGSYFSPGLNVMYGDAKEI
jgi:hypothetical protein